MAIDVAAVLGSAKLEEIEKPKPLPEGNFQAKINKHFYEEVKMKDGDVKLKAVYQVEPVMAYDNVDEEELTAFGDLKKAKLRVEFWFDPKPGADNQSVQWRVKNFLTDHVGLELDGAVSLEQAMPMAVNNYVGITVKHTRDEKKPDSVFANVESTFRAE